MMLQRNPEFLRNVWIALTPGRLLLMPVILTVVFWAVYLASDDMPSFLAGLQPTAAIALAILLFLIGLKEATDALVSEVNQQTWDSQRMTAIGPFNMVIGKIFGGAVYAWYGAVYCGLVMITAALMMPDTLIHLKQLAIIVLSAVLCYAASQCWVLTNVQKNRYRGNLKSTSYIVLIIAALMLFGIIYQVFLSQVSTTTTIKWYGLNPSWTNFLLFSIVYFLVWSVVGFYRTMRLEFKFKNGPWVWLIFLATLWIYGGGFVTETVLEDISLRWLARIYVGFGLAVVLTYLTAFNEPKDVVLFRKLIFLFQNRHWARFQKRLPLFLVTLAVAVLICIITLITSIFIIDAVEKAGTSPAVWYSLAILAFLLRDITILIYANLRLKAHRADVAILIYLMMLYVLVPLILNLLKLEYLLPAFVPHLKGTLLNGLGLVLLQCGLVLFLLYRRWQQVGEATKYSK
jgi:hypothetical protein